MTTTKTTLSAAFALALALGLGACSTDDDSQTPDQTAGQEVSDDGADAGADSGADSGATEEDTDAGSGDDAATQGDLTAQALQAIEAAEEEAGGTAYEIDDQDGDRTWEVDVAVGDRSVEVTLDADGTVIKTEDDDLDGDDRAGLDAATITLSDAIKLAIGEVGGVLDDAELDEDDGTYYWEVSVDGTDQGDDVEVKVSVTGEIIEID